MKPTWVLSVLLLAAVTARADDTGTATLQGRVEDPLGATVPGATVTIAGPATSRSTRTDGAGRYAFAGLAPVRYSVTASKDGFSPLSREGIDLAAGSITTLDLSLSLAPVEEHLTVKEAPPPVSLEPENNGGALVIKGEALEALPDDPDELAEALQALAGPAAGPNGGQIFIDGFTGGRMPPKSSIREIRINANPFSAEFDRLGYGRIEIFTKPGSDRLRTEVRFRFNDDSLNSRNPFAPNKPPFQRRELGGNLSGPLVSKRASFFLDFERRDVDDDTVINATLLDSSLDPVPFSRAVLTPSHRTTLSPRLDWQISDAHTLTARYTVTTGGNQDAGIGGFSLPSRAYDTSQRQQTFQLSETATLGKAVNELRVRFWSESHSEGGPGALPTLQVLDAFTGGGASVGDSRNQQKRWELQNLTSWSWGRHSLRAGLRLRTVSEIDVSRNDFAGTVVFTGGLGPLLDDAGEPVLGPDGQPVLVPLTSLDRYRRTLLLEQQGLSPTLISALGGGASQLQISGGEPETRVSQWDLAPFVQDDWKLAESFLLSLGLRYEIQNHLHSSLNLAPRLGFAWSPGSSSSAGRPGAAEARRTVIRGGFGVFYDRFDESLTLRTIRFDGEHTRQYLVTDPAVLDRLDLGLDGSVSNLPSVAELGDSALPQVTWTLAPDLQSPYTLQSSLSVEQQLPGGFALTGTFIAAQGRRLLRSRNVNAPLPDGRLPLGAARGAVYQMESTGRLNQLEGIVGVNNRISPRLLVFLRYFLTRARSDTDGVGSFPADSYDLSGEYGRARTDVRHRLVLGGSVAGPWGIRVSPFLIASTGGPYNVTIGRDLNGDGLFTDRPGFATDPSLPGVVSTPFGLLDPDPGPDETIIPRNLGQGPGFVVLNLRLSRTIHLGGQREVPPPGSEPGGRGPRGPGFGRPGGGRRFGGGGRRGPGGGAGGRGLTFSISAQNLLNHTNPAAPVGNLSSPFFGQSLASAGGFGRGGSAAGNRRIEIEARLVF